VRLGALRNVAVAVREIAVGDPTGSPSSWAAALLVPRSCQQ
jgi:hypothetical protein